MSCKRIIDCFSRELRSSAYAHAIGSSSRRNCSDLILQFVRANNNNDYNRQKNNIPYVHAPRGE